MRLYLVRHGDAVSAHPSGDRPLSDRGREEVGRMAEVLAPKFSPVEEIVHSGKARAEQTARLLQRGIGAASVLKQWDGLRPDDPVAPIAARIESENSDLMIVGHLPFLPKLAGLLLCGEPLAVFTLRTGAVACLQRVGADAWRIEWLLHPGLYGVGRAHAGASP